MIRSALALLIALAASPAMAQWKAEQADARKYPKGIVEEKRQPAPSGIPYMLTETAPGARDIVAAWYAEETTRYRHAVLGDGIEGGALVVQLANKRKQAFRLPRSEVFEDIAPRLADLDRDGRMEVVAIVSSLEKGAQLAVFGMEGDFLVKKADTPFIGQPNRWLNIAAISNFSTRGGPPEIALVATPHIGGTLAFFRYVPGQIIQFAAERGYSNHVIGSSELRLSAVADIDEDGKAELALPSADRKVLRIVETEGTKIAEIDAVALPAAIDKAILVEDKGKKAAFVVGLEDGTVWRVTR